ncbi:amidohydrolase family protein [Polymorphobacter arshaanensis]|uniref:Amidohydrolase family protein n=1 Tax=Glacieibacterium arshaanense TaxID=2511025 RepID=A0A4Y9EML1_9SPHN|nr:amidohydrolase family protein [Polymorphobacter arshaanensis]TFU03258.1 amidohydrolase family protein [Polymorphobacter arshaanensis]
MYKLLLATALAAALPVNAEITAIRAGHVITDASQPARGASTILVENGRIIAINDAAAAIPAGATVVDMSGKTVLPGLIDVHVHLGGYSDDPWYAGVAPKRTEEYAVAIGLNNALITARAGFTTVREVGGGQRATIAVRDAINDGLAPGPRIQTAGSTLSIIGGHADNTVGINPEIGDALDKMYPQIGVCTGADGCATAVRLVAKSRADLIKIVATGGVLDDGKTGLEQHFTNAEMKSIVDTAHSLGLKVAAHAHGARGIEAAVNAGVDSIEHGTFADTTDINLMKAKGTYMVATLMAIEGLKEHLGKGFFTPNVEAKGLQTVGIQGKALAAAYKAGVPIALGTDSGVYKHGRNAEELPLMVKLGGMSPKDALYAATMGGAKLMGIETETGSLVAGKSADLIAVDGDPLTDPAAVLKIRYVMVKGKPISLQ